MDKAARATLLRQRFRAVGGLPYVASGKVRQKAQEAPKPAKIYLQWPEANRDTKRAGAWMQEADAKTPEKELGARNRREVSPLTKIAAKWRRFS